MAEDSIHIKAFIDTEKLQKDLALIRAMLAYLNRWRFFHWKPVTKFIIWVTTGMILFTVKRHTNGRR